MAEDSKLKYYFAKGRRKTAHARVKLTSGKGLLTINNTPCDINGTIKGPFELVGQDNKWDINASVHGGGKTSQVEAIQLAVSRALLLVDGGLKTTLKKSHFLTRDSREKERKKPGLKRARRAPQWSKR